MRRIEALGLSDDEYFETAEGRAYLHYAGVCAGQ